ncbi:MAG TPA: pitrilysin family protein, partial [Thermoanaerobaculia bacterium]|nr:pitrilysin family protein [Thermoanaerobaculia bacterium]
RKWVDPKNMLVAAAGDFKKADMAARLDKLFAGWPQKGEAAPSVPKPSHAAVPGTFLVDKDVNQGRVSIMLPGLLRTDPDFFAAALMNDILGGGGFTSRITNRVRSDEGLAYSAGSALQGGIWYPGRFGAAFQSKVRTAAYASQIVIEEMKKLRDGDVTDEELDTAKRSFIDTLPRRFSTPVQVTGLLADEEFTGRYASDPGYYAKYQANVEKVTKADVKRQAQRLLKAEVVTLLVVGKKVDLLNPDPKHPVKFADLTNGKLTEVPLRDPLTMQPMAAVSAK